MSFFDRPARVDRTKVVLAAWHRRRTEVLPGVAPVALLLARTDDTAVALTDVRGIRTGSRSCSGCAGGPPAGRDEPPWPVPMLGSPDPLGGNPFPDELLRFGVQFADGRRVTNMDGYPYVPEELPPDQPVLTEGAEIDSEGSGLGRGASWDLDQFVQPLPPPGPLAFFCAWPGRGIPEARVEIDAALVLDAAATAVPYFPAGGRR